MKTEILRIEMPPPTIARSPRVTAASALSSVKSLLVVFKAINYEMTKHFLKRAKCGFILSHWKEPVKNQLSHSGLNRKRIMTLKRTQKLIVHF